MEYVDIQFDWFGFDQTSKINRSKAAESKQNKQEFSHTVIPPFKFALFKHKFYRKKLHASAGFEHGPSEYKASTPTTWPQPPPRPNGYFHETLLYIQQLL